MNEDVEIEIINTQSQIDEYREIIDLLEQKVSITKKNNELELKGLRKAIDRKMNECDRKVKLILEEQQKETKELNSENEKQIESVESMMNGFQFSINRLNRSTKQSKILKSDYEKCKISESIRQIEEEYQDQDFYVFASQNPGIHANLEFERFQYENMSTEIAYMNEEIENLKRESSQISNKCDLYQKNQVQSVEVLLRDINNETQKRFNYYDETLIILKKQITFETDEYDKEISFANTSLNELKSMKRATIKRCRCVLDSMSNEIKKLQESMEEGAIELVSSSSIISHKNVEDLHHLKDNLERELQYQNEQNEHLKSLLLNQYEKKEKLSKTSYF